TWSTLISDDMDSNESRDDHDMEEHRSTNEDVDPNASLDDFIQQNIVKESALKDFKEGDQANVSTHVAGDNETLFPGKSGDAAIFNNFIQESGLIDLPMGGRSFTWMNKDLLEAVVSMKEIKMAVWDCSSNKALGRQILDGPLILSEIIDWYKKRKKKLMLFKVDFKKAFDYVSWKYLDYMLHKLGFGSRWRTWINNCLMSARTSILINRSPTSEFSHNRASNMFHGVRIGSNIHLSHLFYADDVIILSDWNQNDMENITMILNIFYIAFGLKINVHKSNVFGVGVSNSEVVSMAILIDRFKARLSGWKANLLSISGRLTLIKSVLGSLVNSVRKHIDEYSLPSLFPCTRWYKMIPKKTLIQFLAWFVMGMLNRMTTSFSLVTWLLQFGILFDHGLIFLFQAFSRVKIGPTGLILGMFLRTKRAVTTFDVTSID
nr:RNA-directed DNA polymerase, eukaryota [Tanacetum cinerariifolium]